MSCDIDRSGELTIFALSSYRYERGVAGEADEAGNVMFESLEPGVSGALPGDENVEDEYDEVEDPVELREGGGGWGFDGGEGWRGPLPKEGMGLVVEPGRMGGGVASVDEVFFVIGLRM